jgi:hypothetical protein
MSNIELKLSAPWTIFTEKMKELFEGDKDITVTYDDCNDIHMIKILVDSQDKYEALVKLLPTIKEFGNAKVLIDVVPSNKTKTRRELFETVFKDNPVFSRILTRMSPADIEATYVMFKPKVARYYADNLSDPWGCNNELYADIAREVFEDTEGIMFSTDMEE